MRLEDCHFLACFCSISATRSCVDANLSFSALTYLGDNVQHSRVSCKCYLQPAFMKDLVALGIRLLYASMKHSTLAPH